MCLPRVCIPCSRFSYTPLPVRFYSLTSMIPEDDGRHHKLVKGHSAKKAVDLVYINPSVIPIMFIINSSQISYQTIVSRLSSPIKILPTQVHLANPRRSSP